jgi:hypothetical protein
VPRSALATIDWLWTESDVQPDDAGGDCACEEFSEEDDAEEEEV